MTDEKFLEKLIRLAWQNGFEIDNPDCREKWYFEFVDLDEDNLVFLDNNLIPECEQIKIHINKYLFNHDFIGVLYALVEEDSMTDCIDEIERAVGFYLSELAQYENRVEYLKQEFGSLVN